ncbi:hypothetical protein M407DRAFT_244801, partial [Tulasnella calospora MUT 4182]
MRKNWPYIFGELMIGTSTPGIRILTCDRKALVGRLRSSTERDQINSAGDYKRQHLSV